MPKTRVFNIMQYEYHPFDAYDEDGNLLPDAKPLITQERIDDALAHRSIKEWAYCWHDEDFYSEKDEADDAIDAALARVEALRAERQREERTRSAKVEELDSLIDKRQRVLDGMDEEIRRHRARKKVEGQAEYDKMLEQAETDSEALRRQKVTEGEREAQRIVNEAHRRSQELLDDIDETLRDAKLLPTAPTEESNFIVDWVKEHAPKVYAAAKKAFDAFIKQREDLRKRTQKLMGNAERYTQQMEDDGYSLR